MSLEVEREQAVQTLCAHYAQDHLTTGELESRFERVYKADSADQLRTVLIGLPALPRTSLAPVPLYQVAAPTPTGALAPGEKRYLSVFAEVKKEGYWVPAPMILGRVVFGSMLLDLREAEIPLEGITLDLDVLFGECKVLLPPGLNADVDASAMLGDVTDKSKRGLPEAPVVRVRGSALFGSIVVKTTLPKAARLESWRIQLKKFLG
ncbi:MAG: DUF1707 and DUF2154 domain-containing protein [Gemmatimonadetes bacterium]|nr:DUF1707 and DUF2154 domain-containing protein [Gemmatimonadota bacterium]